VAETNYTLGAHVPRGAPAEEALGRSHEDFAALKLEAGSHFSDISEFQPNVNWAAYGGNRHAVVVRAHNGWRTDYSWSAHRDGARGSCSFRGWYQYLVPGKDVVQQANQFCDTVGMLLPGEVAVLDFEDPGFGGNQVGNALAWFGTVGTRLHANPNQLWFYSYWPYVQSHFGGRLDWVGHPSWIAGYSGAVPWWRPQAVAWQHTDGQYGDHQCQPAPGLGSFDCSVYAGSIDQLVAFVGGGVAPVQEDSSIILLG
jgi:hypothetical protein